MLFCLLPRRLFGGKRVRRPEPAEPASAAGARLRRQLDRAAQALRDVYDCMGRSSVRSTDENPAIIFDRAAEKVCRGCALCELCWQREYTSTFNALNDATPMLLERGRAMAKDLPGYFSSRCIHLPDFLTAVNGELSAHLLRRQYRRQLEETRRSARGSMPSSPSCSPPPPPDLAARTGPERRGSSAGWGRCCGPRPRRRYAATR